MKRTVRAAPAQRPPCGRFLVPAAITVLVACASQNGGGEVYTAWDQTGGCEGLITTPWGVSLGGTALGPCMFPGRFVWITYDALWCRTCRGQVAEGMEAARRSEGSTVFVGVLGGGRDPTRAATPDELAAWAAFAGLDPRHAVSEGAAPRSLPQHALIGPDGRTWYRHVGPLRAGEIVDLLSEFVHGRRQPPRFGGTDDQEPMPAGPN